jgi:hypothetical protein
MNENLKTGIYVGLAAVFGLLAWLTLPSSQTDVGPSPVGKPLFEKFDDTTNAASLEIVWYDNTLNETKSFKVANVGGQWVIPSHHNYPADAQRQLQEAVQALYGLECLGEATHMREEHEKFSVVEPPPPGPGATLQKGLGKLIVLKDAKGDDLVRMVVGDAVEGSPEQRFLRIAKSGDLIDHVYVAKVDLEKLPTDFGKWIERDLLRLNPNDIAKMTLKDYSILKALDQNTGRTVFVPQLRMDATVSWDTLDNNWALNRFVLYDDRAQPRDAALAEGEELSRTKLDDLKNALDDLKIEGVDRKPEGLGAELAVEEGVATNKELEESLQRHGYIVGSLDGKKMELFSSNGEIVVDLKDGVRYTLRFGDVAGVQEGSDAGKLNRFLLVSAQVAHDLIPPPVLEPEPAGPAAEPAKSESAKEEPAKTEPAKEEGGCQEEQPKVETEKGSPKGKTAGEKAGKSAKTAKESSAKGEKGNPPDAKPNAAPPPAASPKPDDAQARLEAIRKENKRRQDLYNEQLNKAKGRVAELNAHFADWYYIISEDTYKKIHLSRSDIIQEGATAKESGFGVDAFRKLEKDGLKSTTPSSGTGSPPRLPMGGGSGPP